MIRRFLRQSRNIIVTTYVATRPTPIRTISSEVFTLSTAQRCHVRHRGISTISIGRLEIEVYCPFLAPVDGHAWDH